MEISHENRSFGQDSAGDGVELGDKLRYRHGAAHVRAALAAGALQLLELAPVATRIEAGVTVPGLVVVAERLR